MVVAGFPGFLSTFIFVIGNSAVISRTKTYRGNVSINVKKMTELKPRVDKILIFSVSFLISSLFVIQLIIIIIKRPEDLKDIGSIIIYILFIVLVGPPLVLSTTYFYIDLTKRVFIDENKKQLIIKSRRKEISITRNDIVESYYVRVASLRGSNYKFPFYKYILLVLKERKRIFITNLLCEPEFLIKHLDLNCKLINSNVPLIDRLLGEGVLTSKEFEDKVLEFENNFQVHSNATLSNIISQKNVYADYAREAASRILKKRK